MEKKFWIVCRDPAVAGGAYGAVKQHMSVGEAQIEAMRLAAKEACCFLVFEAVGYARPTEPPVAWVEYRAGVPE